MSDQAQQLRQRMRRAPQTTPSQRVSQRVKKCHTIAVSSGKGGVGKTNFTVNFAIQLAISGYKVVIFDADLGMANVDVLMGMTPRYTLFDLLQSHLSVDDVMGRGPHGIRVISGKSGLQELFSLPPDQGELMRRRLKELHYFADFIIIDTGAGLSPHTLPLILTADEVVLVTTPEPTAMTDGYAVMKYLFKQRADLSLQLLINRVSSRAEAERTGNKMKAVAKQFLQCEVDMLGYLPESREVVRSVKRQQPFSDSFPHSSVSRRLRLITSRYLSAHTKVAQQNKGSGFMRFLHQVIRGKS